MPSSSDPSANGSPADPPPLRPPMRSTARSATKNVNAPTAKPNATLQGLPIRRPSCASSKATLEMRAPAPKASTTPTTRSPQRRASASNAPNTNELAASAPHPNAAHTVRSYTQKAPFETVTAERLADVHHRAGGVGEPHRQPRTGHQAGPVLIRRAHPAEVRGGRTAQRSADL